MSMGNEYENRAIHVGYACQTLGVQGTAMKTCRLECASIERLEALTAQNLTALEKMISYNAENDIRLFRISSELVPFGSHPDVSFEWQDVFAPHLNEIGRLIKASGVRVSMHPGQYTVLNSVIPDVVRRSIDDLNYHERILNSLQADDSRKIVLHIGGISGGKPEALKRFRTHFSYLDDSVKRRLVIENDDRHFNIADVLETGTRLGIPVVFDSLHHKINGCGAESPYEWIKLCNDTWRKTDGRQKLHYSQQDKTKRAGAHSQTVHVRSFLKFAEPLYDIDIMLEVKDKNLSAIKCALCLDSNGSIHKLEKQWSLYKYLVLEKNPAGYQAIRELLKDKSAYPAAEFFEIIEVSLEMGENKGFAVNAAQHVWGYFKTVCEPKEKAAFDKLAWEYEQGRISFSRLKKFLFRLCMKYKTTYLLEAYFFLDEIYSLSILK